jgi:hypothetical protein
MTKRPSFEGFRSPECTRQSVLAMYRDFVQTSGIDPSQSDIVAEIVAGTGELGQAWDRLVETLTQAISDPIIEKNPACVEFLQIMRSLANTTTAATTVDMLFEPLKPIFQKQMAFDNKLKSHDKFFLAQFWMLDDLERNGGAKGSKNKIAKDYAIKIKNKFGLTVSADTIARHWL